MTHQMGDAMSRKIFLVALALVAALGALIAALLIRSAPSAPLETSSVQLPEQPAAELAGTKPMPMGEPAELRPSGIAPETELEILRDAGDPAAKLRGVKLAGDRQQIACGEIMPTNARKYARFIWLAEANKVVADDGRGEFAQLAPLCDGKGLP